MDPNSEFRKKLLEYLESVHVSDFLTGSKNEVLTKMKEAAHSADYRDPTQTLPVPPPESCTLHDFESDNDVIGDELCVDCKASTSWWKSFNCTFDDIFA